MRIYPVYVSARHEDGSSESFTLKVKGSTPGEAMDLAYKESLPRYAGQEGWTIAAVVDEFMATDVEEGS